MNTIAAIAAAGVAGWVAGWATNLPRLYQAEHARRRLAAELARRDHAATLHPTPLERNTP